MSKTTRAPTLRDVAQLAGVSSATVSYVLSGRQNGDTRISDETRDRVLAAVAELRYVPNQTARSLRRNRTERVCLLLQRLGVPSNDVLVRDVQRAADRNGYTVIVAVGGSPERDQQVLDQLRRGLADGVVAPGHLAAEELLPLVESGLAVVSMSNHVAGAGIDIVGTTELASCYQAMTYLLEKGHRRIGFLGHFTQMELQSDRYESYLSALRDANIPINQQFIRNGAESREEAYVSTQQLLQLHERPTAILAGSDRAAVSTILAVRDAGLRVPDDIAVVGVGNIPEGEIIRPHLTTVGPSPLDFSPVADMLFSRLRGEAPAHGRTITLQWKLIVRESS